VTNFLIKILLAQTCLPPGRFAIRVLNKDPSQQCLHISPPLKLNNLKKINFQHYHTRLLWAGQHITALAYDLLIFIVTKQSYLSRR
jgi:hypothetical protein